MANPGIIKSLVAGGVIPAYTAVKFGSDDNTVVAAAAATDLVMGTTMELAAASGERCDVQLNGIANVLAGAAITRGSLVTVDASGRAIAAAPAAGSNVTIIGRAFESASAAGDVIRVMLVTSSMQG